MTQRSITSFFSRVKPSEEDEEAPGSSKRETVASKENKRLRKTGSSDTEKSPIAKKSCKSPRTPPKVKEEKTEGRTLLSQDAIKKEAKVEAVGTAAEPEKDENVQETKTNANSNREKSPPINKEVKMIFSQESSDGKSTKSDDYNPATTKYDPIKSATWKRGEKVPYIALTRTLEEIEDISGRLKTIECLSNFFRSVIVLTPEDLLPAVYLCLNKLAPAYEGKELGVADTNLMKAIAHSTGRSLSQIKSDFQSMGDLGLIAEQSKSNQRMIYQPARLMLRTVFEKLIEISNFTGNASQSKKVEKIQSMFVACKNSEARFLIRSLAGKLRIGLAEQSVLQALALACAMTPPNQEYPPKVLNASKKMSAEAFKALYDKYTLLVKTAYCECPNYAMIISNLLANGVEDLPKYCKITPAIPLKPMLAHPTKGIQEVLQRFDGMKFTCEYKYDGERAQIHINGDEISIFSRNQENNTSKYPDIISRIEKCRTENVQSAILDCEAVAWDREQKMILPFQVLSTRKRKDADEATIKVQVCVFMFDLLYFNGESLVKKPFLERRNLLKDNFKEVEGEWKFVTHLDTSTMEEVQEFLEESIKGNCEGLMVKTLEKEATYEIAKRSHKWLKLKKDYLDSCGDTLDLVVIGGYSGKGKRTGTFGGFLLACYDKENEEFQSICKIGTGFSDEDLQKHSEFFKERIIPSPKSYYRYDPSHEPDHWFDTAQVWEVKCADLSLSPVHRAAIGIIDSSKGISLRFPRFIRIRDDKDVESATSSQQVASLYSSQEQVKNQAGNKFEDEDFY